MPRKLVNYVRQNAIALLALFVALGGTSYAALSINGSQIRNRTIDSVKFDPKSIAGSIRAWVNLQWNGQKLVALASDSQVKVAALNDGEYVIWKHRTFSSRCIAIATPRENVFNLGSPGAGFVTATLYPRSHELFLNGYGLDGKIRAQDAFAMIVCP